MHADGDGFLLFTFEQIALFLFYASLKIVGVGKQIYFSYTALFSKLIVSSRGEAFGRLCFVLTCSRSPLPSKDTVEYLKRFEITWYDFHELLKIFKRIISFNIFRLRYYNRCSHRENCNACEIRCIMFSIDSYQRTLFHCFRK